jgi:hypothetical protein
MLKTIRRKIINIPGWHTDRKIVVLDSDDWGSIGLPSLEVFNRLSHSGFRIENNPYLKYDSLASEDDLTALFETLKKFKDRNGRSPLITANTVVANPDFAKIRASDYSEYHYELFTDSLKRYPKHSGSFELWKQGMQESLFYPQFHAREHLNVDYWMHALKEGNKQILLGFNNEFYILDNATHPEIKHSCTSAHYPKSIMEHEQITKAIEDGLQIFQKVFGYPSRSFTGTGYIWSSKIEPMLKDNDVRFLKGIIIQRDPVIGTQKFNRRYHYTGKKNKHGLIHLVRNAFFEPALTKDKEKSVTHCLERVDTAFSSRKPALIATHRINYIGYIEEKFRNENLKLLFDLLKQILKKYPDVEFYNSDELGSMIVNE